MYALCPGLVIAAEAAGRQAVKRFDLIRPDIDVGLDVPLEATDPGRVLREVQALLTLAERLPRLFLFINIRAEANAPNNLAAGVPDRGRAYAHPALPTPIASLVKSL